MIMRQPGDEKRFTVAWPMPREAPVTLYWGSAPWSAIGPEPDHG
jgi:hypothetical protein